MSRRKQRCFLLYLIPALLGLCMGTEAIPLAAAFGLYPGLRKALAGRTNWMTPLVTAGIAALVSAVAGVLGVASLALWGLVALDTAESPTPVAF